MKHFFFTFLLSFAECHFGKELKELGSTWFPDLGAPFGKMYCIKCECVPVSTARNFVFSRECELEANRATWERRQKCVFCFEGGVSKQASQDIGVNGAKLFQHLVNFLHTDSLQIFARWVFKTVCQTHFLPPYWFSILWNRREKRTHKRRRQILRTALHFAPKPNGDREMLEKKCFTSNICTDRFQIFPTLPRNRCKRSGESSHVFSVETSRTSAPSRHATSRFCYQEGAAKRVQATHSVSLLPDQPMPTPPTSLRHLCLALSRFRRTA